MNGRRIRRIAAAALALAVAGCGSAATSTTRQSDVSEPTGSTEPPTIPPPSTTPSSVSTPLSAASTLASPPSVAVDPALAGIVARAVADLSNRVGVAPTAVTTITAEAITWPDRSLGCPKPGMNYAQVTVDGARIRLAAAGATYDYHSGDDGRPFLCQPSFPGAPITIVGGG